MRTLRTLIFGTNDYAQLAHWYLTNDSNYYPTAFVVTDEQYRTQDKLLGLPVLTWAEMIDGCHPDSYNLFAPIRDNKFRRLVFDNGIALGYNFISYIHSSVLVPNVSSVAANCFIQEKNNIQPFAKIGENCIIWAGNHIGHHSIIEQDVTITSHCVISGHCRIGAGSFLGVNCTIRDGITIAKEVFIAQGSNVVKDCLGSGKIYIGNPAKLIHATE